MGYTIMKVYLLNSVGLIVTVCMIYLIPWYTSSAIPSLMPLLYSSVAR